MRVLFLDGIDRPLRVVRHARAARRLRLEIPDVAGRPRAARAAQAILRRADQGIEEVRVDWRTGRALLEYAPGAKLLEGLGEAPTPRTEEPRTKGSSP